MALSGGTGRRGRGRIRPSLVAGMLGLLLLSPGWLPAIGPPAYLGSGSFGEARAEDKVATRLYVRDALTVPGRPVRIEARLVRSGLLNEVGVGGEQVTFFVDGKEIGTSLSGGDGRAFSSEHAVRMRGNHVIRAKVTGSKRVQDAEGQAVFACWERRRPILLVDVGVLITPPPPSRLPIPALPLEFGRRDPPVPDAAAAPELDRLTKFYFNPIYVTRSGANELSGENDVREWLRKHQFPTGLWIALKPGREALKSKIDELKADGWENLKAGIGDSLDFAEALLEHRMTVVILPKDDGPDTWPRKAMVVKDWKEARGKLQ